MARYKDYYSGVITDLKRYSRNQGIDLGYHIGQLESQVQKEHYRSAASTLGRILNQVPYNWTTQIKSRHGLPFQLNTGRGKT